MEPSQEQYWTERYKDQRTGWDIGYPSTPLVAYFDQLKSKEISILIPGAGNAYEAQYLHEQGFQNVFVLDISKTPLRALKERVPTFPEAHLLHGDFFEHKGQYNLIIEQTFFCSFEPTIENRQSYALQMSRLVKQGGRLVGLWFNHALSEEQGRPFGGTREEYLGYLSPYFKVAVFEDCYNSIPPRMGKELFGIFEAI